jgi:hypothetical protein
VQASGQGRGSRLNAQAAVWQVLVAVFQQACWQQRYMGLLILFFPERTTTALTSFLVIVQRVQCMLSETIAANTPSPKLCLLLPAFILNLTSCFRANAPQLFSYKHS